MPSPKPLPETNQPGSRRRSLSLAVLIVAALFATACNQYSVTVDSNTDVFPGYNVSHSYSISNGSTETFNGAGTLPVQESLEVRLDGAGSGLYDVALLGPNGAELARTLVLSNSQWTPIWDKPGCCTQPTTVVVLRRNPCDIQGSGCVATPEQVTVHWRLVEVT